MDEQVFPLTRPAVARVAPGFYGDAWRRLRRNRAAMGGLAIVALFGLLIYFGLGQIRSERMLGTTSEALAIPQWWYTAGIPAFGLVVIVRIIQGALRADRRARG